jgi:hypothetical protein
MFMKITIIAALGLGVLLASCSGAKETVKTEDSAEVKKSEYGKIKVNTDEAISVSQMMSDFKAKGNVESVYTVKGEINQVCAKMGCWIKVNNPDGEEFMVRFKDHFTIPTDTKAGVMAALHGRAYVDTVSVDMLRHYAEDAGDSQEEIEKITEPKINFGFEADGIKLL